MLSKIKNEEIITFIQQGHSQLNSIKSDNVYNITNVLYFK